MMQEEITIAYPVNKLFRGAESGTYLHISSEGRWVHEHRKGCCGKATRINVDCAVIITEKECEINIVRARREARNATARLQNLEKLQLELCLMRQNRVEPEHFSDDEHYLTVSSCDEVIGEDTCPECGVTREPGDAPHHGFRCDCWQQ